MIYSEFALAEKRILGRSSDALTARTAYAGGKAGALDGKVCYYNSKRYQIMDLWGMPKLFH